MSDDVKVASSEPDTVEKSPLTLDKLPLDVLENVKGQLQLADCLSLRKVSRDLRSFVDSTEGHCKVLSFRFRDRRATMVLDDLELKYSTIEYGGYDSEDSDDSELDYDTDEGDGGCVITSKRLDTQKTKTCKDDRYFKQALIDDASTILKMPKLQIGLMDLQCVEKNMQLNLVQCLKTRNLPLNVRSIRGDDLELLHSIQEVLNPEKLEEIICSEFYLSYFLRREINLEFLENPKLKFGKVNFMHHGDELVAQYLKIVKSLNFEVRIQSVFIDDSRWIPTILQTLDSEKVEDMKIVGGLTVDEFNEIARNKQWKKKTRLGFNLFPIEIGLEQYVDIKEIRINGLALIEENLIIIRDILLKSPHLKTLELRKHTWGERIEDVMNEINERIERVMSADPTYDAETRRFSIPNTSDYFQLKFERTDLDDIRLMIERMSPE